MRRTDIDFLKGFAIIAVILYHMYILKSGYLGVDLFFVVSGYLILPRLVDAFSQEIFKFDYLEYLKKRIFRLWPLIVIATCVCFAIGYAGMLPDDFENLSENIVAANLLSTNILSSITIKDYWAVRTSYQPLMHLWYVGLLFEYYLLLPIILYATRHVAIVRGLDIRKTINGTLIFMSIISFVVYLLPGISEMSKFYLLPARFFELTVGGIASSVVCGKNRYNKYIYMLCLGLLCAVICISCATIEFGHLGVEEIPVGANITIAPSNIFLLPRPACLILTVLLTVVVLVQDQQYAFFGGGISKILCHLGKMSYSLFIWHQIMLAFYRYYFTDKLSWTFVIVFFFVLYLISLLSYYMIEQNFKSNLSHKVMLLISIVVCSISIWTYCNAGVVRDVPELNIYKSSIKRGQHKLYTDRIYKLSKPFEDNGKINILLKGNSFARDFGSILMESAYHDKINIFLIKDWSKIDESMLKKCDYAFIFSEKSDVPDMVWNNITAENIYGIGTKTFGDSNGVIYKKRFSSVYFTQVITPRQEYVRLNNKWAESWGDHYINLMKMSMDDSGKVRVFTPDSMYISQDCRHLTQAGARYFESMIDFDRIFSDYINAHK